MNPNNKAKIIGMLIFLFVAQILLDGGLISNLASRYGYDTSYAYSLVFRSAILGILYSAIATTILPLTITLIRRKRFFEKGKLFCALNSIAFWLPIPVLAKLVFSINIPTIGWLGAICFYYIQKWIFVAEDRLPVPTTINPEDNEPKIIEIEVSPTKKITLEPSSYHVDTASTTWVCPKCKRQNLTSRNSCWNCNTKAK